MIEIIAELSGNHGGNLDNAIALISAAHGAGATGVKFQCFEPERLAIKRAGHPRIHKSIPMTGAISVDGPVLSQLYREIHTPRHWFPEMIHHATNLGLTWHSSVFDPDDVAFLEALDCPRYKIASFEAWDNSLRDAVERTHKPVVISANQHDGVMPRQYWTVLHATDYGVDSDHANLNRIKMWAQDRIRFPTHWAWGLSDHTTDHLAGEIAATLGACMIEWHLKLPGVETPDDAFSWEPEDFALKANCVREIERALR